MKGLDYDNSRWYMGIILMISILLSGLILVPERAGSIDDEPVNEQMSLSGFMEIEDVAERLTYPVSIYGPTTWGDIDGNGFDDTVQAIVDYPKPEDPEKTGAIMIHFDVSQGGKKCLFKGSDPRDRLGCWVEVSDINGDGLDDILAGAYGADGSNDTKYHCGEIHIIYGKDNRSFPNSTDMENISDIILEGNSPKKSGHEDYPGDMVGREFTVLDMDGDGYEELIVANSAGWGIGYDGRIWKNRGCVSSYQLLDIINAGKRHIVLQYPSNDWAVIGMDEGDNLGWITRRADVNGDGLLDLVISAPGADGEGNIYPEIGETFVIKGSRYRFLDLKTSGPAFEVDDLYCRSGTSLLNISFRDTSRRGGIVKVELELWKGPDNITLQIDTNGSRFIHGSQEDIKILGSIFQNDHNGSSFCEIEIYINWSIPLKGPTNVKVSLLDMTGNSTFTVLRNRLNIIKDIGLMGKPTIKGGGIPVELTGGHVLPETPIIISNIDVSYVENTNRNPDPESVEIVMISEDGSRDSFLNGDGHDLTMEAGNEKMENVTIMLNIPEYLDAGSRPPDLSEPYILKIPVDLEDPKKPCPVSFEMERNDADGSMYDVSLDWKDELGKEGDHNGSGVKYYQIGYMDHSPVPVMEKGGLLATCFNGDDLSTGVFHYIEDDLNVNWGAWGPDPSLIYRDDFSVRWHGWLMQEEGGGIDLDLEGTGNVRLLIRGETVLNWTSLTEHPSVDEIEVDDNEYVPLEIYYRYEGENSHFKMTLEDTSGEVMVPGPDILYHPTTTFNHTIDQDGSITYWVNSIDWTGRISEPLLIEEDIDSTSPSIQMDDVPDWFNRKNVAIGCSITDRSIGNTHSGSIDVESIEYMVHEDGSPQENTWTKKGIRIEENPNLLHVSVDIEGKDGWTGIIQFRASDTEMNMGFSEPKTIGFDLTSPQIEIVDPDGTYTITEGSLTISTRATDIGGSGVDHESMKIKSRIDEGQWSDWSDMETENEDGEVLGSITISSYPSSIELQTSCLDLVGNPGFSAILELDIIKKAENRPPIPVISSPGNDSYHQPGSTLILDATGTRDDGKGDFEDLHLTWISNISGYITNDAISEVSLENGRHRLTLYADDGTNGHNISKSVVVQVGLQEKNPDEGIFDPIPQYPDDGSNWPAFFLVIVAISILVSILGMLYLMKKGTMHVSAPEVEDTDNTDHIEKEISLTPSQRR